MINYLALDISTVTNGLVAHGVNCQGVMGSGVAKALRDKHPEIFFAYKNRCDYYKKHEVSGNLLGLIDYVVVNNTDTNELIIVNCFTQDFYGRDQKRYASTIAVAASLDKTVQLAKRFKLDMYMPKIGCGLGGLDWDTEVEPLIQSLSSIYRVDVNVCII